ncbi:MAG: GNAT family N-acetyltransferase [Candidatus Poseidoniales archaeon]
MNVDSFIEKDLDNLMLFLDKNVTENYDKKVFLTIKNRWPEGFLIIKKNDEIIGVSCGAIQPNLKLRILIIALDKSYRRRGYGKKLLNMMVERSLVYGVKKVTLEVRKDSSAISFYRNLNFSSVDVLPCYYQDGCDGIVMEKLI